MYWVYFRSVSFLFLRSSGDVLEVFWACVGGNLLVPRAKQIGYDFSDGQPGCQYQEGPGCTGLPAPGSALEVGPREERSDER